ncbi:hypothetical protein F5887DRAFT_1259834 [Amanita rubescens]|nr:hypothetical protein F5887DRAFT_1259834 [Amanita rubescens]
MINKVFGVGEGFAQVSHDGPGKANIDAEFRHPNNDKIILHDSEGFEPGEVAKFDTTNFMPSGFVSQYPVAGDRVAERGVEDIVNLVRGRGVPHIVVFTKYDILVTSEIRKSAFRGGSTEQLWLDGEEKAKRTFKELCVDPLTKAIGEVPIMRVSSGQRYKDTIRELIQATDKEIQKQTGVPWHTEPSSLNFSLAQRADNDLKIEASIDIGRKRYWNGLLSSTDFRQKKLQQCLDVIHRDIVSVWNIHDSNAYLVGNDFKAKMLVLVDDLVANPNTKTPSDGLTMVTVAAIAGAASTPAGIVILSIGTAVLFAKWIFDVYQNTFRNIACVMAYIVDLTIVMHRLSAIDISEESVVSALEDYAKSPEIAQVHNDIRTFCECIPTSRLGDKDYTLEETIRLIEKHRVQAPQP